MIRFGPAAAPRWFDQRLDRLDAYLDYLVAHGAGSVEFVVHGGSPGQETERVHLSRANWGPAIAAAQCRGLDVHVHAPLTPEYRLSRWATDQETLAELFTPIVDLLVQIEQNQLRPPVFVLHGASTTEGAPGDDERSTSGFIRWLAVSLQSRESAAQIALELRLNTDKHANRFDRSLSSLTEYLAHLKLPNVGICWDIANYFGGGANMSMPTATDIRRINHVHLHDRHPGGAGLHAPLGEGELPWWQAIQHLLAAEWSGAVTLEIRYRYALEQGEPWTVLGSGLDKFRESLTWE